MKKWTFVALLLVGAAILGSTVLHEPIANAAKDVGTTIVGPLDGQGNVKVAQQGTANVNVTNGTLAVEPSGEQPVQRGLEFTFGNGNGDPTNNEVDTYQVPAGKRLRIDYVTVQDPRFSDVRQLDVLTDLGGERARHHLDTSRQGDFGFVASDLVEIYADPGTVVTFLIVIENPTGGGNFPPVVDGSFTGVLTDAS